MPQNPFRRDAQRSDLFIVQINATLRVAAKRSKKKVPEKTK
jgi:hypothetical protein